MLPAEERAEALKLELTWIDEMKAGLYEQSIKGDYAAIREARGLIDQPAKLLGLYPSGPGDQHLHVHGVSAEDVGIRVIAPEWTGPAEEAPHTIEHQRALPPPRPEWQSPPKPEELPSNVTPLASQRSRSSYYAKDDAIKERARVEGWTADRHPNPVMSAFQKPPGKNSWMR